MKTFLHTLLFVFCAVIISGQTGTHPSYYGEDIPMFKAGKAITDDGLKVDSIKFFHYTNNDSGCDSKFSYLYNQDGYRTLVKYQVRQFNTETNTYSGWETYHKHLFSYDNSGNMKMSSIKVPDEPYEWRTRYFYNEDNQEVYESYDRTFDSINWTDEGNMRISYDIKKRIISEITFYYKSFSTDSLKTEYTYDSTGNNILIVSSYGTGNNWSLSGRKEFEYDSAHRVVLSKYYYSDGLPGIFLGSINYYTYDDKGNQLTVEEYGYNRDGSDFGAKRTENVYDDMGNITDVYEKTLVTKNKSDSSSCHCKTTPWTISNYKKYAYDKQGNLTLFEEYNWYNGVKSGTYKYFYLYDKAGNKTSDIMYQYYDSKWNLVGKYYYFWSKDSLDSKKDPSGIAKNSNNTGKDNFICYTDQSSKTLYILQVTSSVNELSIYSLEGRKVNQTLLKAGLNEISLRNCYSGIYIISIGRGNERYSKKILIR